MATVEDIMTKNVITVGPDETISKAISKMNENEIHHLPLAEDGKYIGMIDFNLLLKRSSLSGNSKVRYVIERTPVLERGTEIGEAARTILDTGLRALPVVEKDKLLGIVTTTDIVYSISGMKELANKRAEDVMSGDPITVDESDTIDNAIRIMREIEESSIPVVDGKGKIKGTLRISDISTQLWREKERMHRREYFRNVGTVKVKDVLGPPVVVKPEDTLLKCVDAMKKGLSSVCAIADGASKPIGVISHMDLLDEIVRSYPQEGVLVNLSGVKFEDPQIYDRIFELVEKYAKNIAKIKKLKPVLINLHIEQYKQKAGEIKYSIRGKMVTKSKTFYARAWEWSLYKAVRDLMEEFEKMVTKSKEMH